MPLTAEAIENYPKSLLMLINALEVVPPGAVVSYQWIGGRLRQQRAAVYQTVLKARKEGLVSVTHPTGSGRGKKAGVMLTPKGRALIR